MTEKSEDLAKKEELGIILPIFGVDSRTRLKALATGTSKSPFEMAVNRIATRIAAAGPVPERTPDERAKDLGRILGLLGLPKDESGTPKYPFTEAERSLFAAAGDDTLPKEWQDNAFAELHESRKKTIGGS